MLFSELRDTFARRLTNHLNNVFVHQVSAHTPTTCSHEQSHSAAQFTWHPPTDIVFEEKATCYMIEAVLPPVTNADPLQSVTQGTLQYLTNANVLGPLRGVNVVLF